MYFSDFTRQYYGNDAEANRTQTHAPVHPEHITQQPDENSLNVNNIFGGNMSKFFDFHKSQQQIHQQYINGQSQISNVDSHRLAIFLENNRTNPSVFDNGNYYSVFEVNITIFIITFSIKGILSQQAQLQKQRFMGNFEKTVSTTYTYIKVENIDLHKLKNNTCHHNSSYTWENILFLCSVAPSICYNTLNLIFKI